MVRTLPGNPRALRLLQATDLAVTANCMTDGLSETKEHTCTRAVVVFRTIAANCIETKENRWI